MTTFATDTRAEPASGATSFASPESARRYAEHQELRALEAAVKRIQAGGADRYAPRFYAWD